MIAPLVMMTLIALASIFLGLNIVLEIQALWVSVGDVTKTQSYFQIVRKTMLFTAQAKKNMMSNAFGMA
ncbi:MAG: hypothetical protein HWE26_18330 [Alteromonadaceae bacterium]|nr:hypothetical protein [Alteromonadaceae bacterium]